MSMKFTHQPGATPVDGFTIRRGIQRGGFGEVYYAVSDAGKEVALKLLQHEQDVELRGVTQCLNLKHPNLVNLFDVRTDSHGESWVVMEYVNGTNLEDVLAAFPNGLPLDEVRDWLAGLVAGVSHLHERGIVHRDLKPANVYRENGTVKVGDVGLSKKLGSDRRGAHTQSVGTVYYMAPEVAKGQYGPEVDVYSLGIMLYELLTGRVPFLGETTAEVLMKHLTAQPNLSPLPERLRSVVGRALEKDPHKRTPSAAQLEEEFLLSLAANALAPAALPPSPRGGGPGRGDDRSSTLNGQTTPFASTASLDAASTPAAPLPHPPRRGEGTSAAAFVAKPTSPPPIPTRPILSQSQPALPRGDARKTRPTRASSTNVSDAQRWGTFAVVLVCALLIFAPGTPRAWIGLGLIVGAYSAALFARSPRWQAVEGESLDESAASPPITPLRQALEEQVRSSRGKTRTIKQLPLGSLLSREALQESSLSLTLASLCACLLSAGAFLTQEFLQSKPTPPSVEMSALFMATTMAGAWALILANQCARRTSWGDRHPRLVNLIAGVLVGTLAFGVDEFLRVEYANTGLPSSAFQSLGVHALTSGRLNPTWLGYVVFFGGLFVVRRWWIDLSVDRSKRVSFGRLFSAGLAAFLVTVFFEFPAIPAMAWAVTLSATVQLAAPWFPTRRRDSFWRS